ncbi:MAG: hypothetical protein ACI3T9_01205 [Romboutsia timonensis]
MEWLTALLVGITAVISAAGTLIVTAMKTKKQIEETIPKKLKKQCSIDTIIIQRMEDIKEILNADRVQIYDFHNGGHYANGRSALKTSCTYEVTRAGVKGYQMYLQALPLSAIPRFTNTLLNKGELDVPDLENIKDSMPGAYNIKKEQGVKGFYDIILENENKEPIGFLGIQYVNNPHKTYNNNEKNEILRLKFFIEENLEQMIKK